MYISYHKYLVGEKTFRKLTLDKAILGIGLVGLK